MTSLDKQARNVGRKDCEDFCRRNPRNARMLLVVAAFYIVRNSSGFLCFAFLHQNHILRFRVSSKVWDKVDFEEAHTGNAVSSGYSLQPLFRQKIHRMSLNATETAASRGKVPQTATNRPRVFTSVGRNKPKSKPSDSLHEQEQNSLKVALDHVDGLMDLYNSAAPDDSYQQGDSIIISPDLVRNALESVVGRCALEPHIIDAALLREIENQVWRIADSNNITGVTPSLKILQDLWGLHEYQLERPTERGLNRDANTQDCFHQSTRFLIEWMSRFNAERLLHCAPVRYIEHLFRFASRQKFKISVLEWRLYEEIRIHDTVELPDSVYACLLSLLSEADDVELQSLQSHVLQDIALMASRQKGASKKSQLDNCLYLSPLQLEQAMRAHAESGLHCDAAAWNCRMLQSFESHNSTLSAIGRSLLVDTLLKSDIPGSLVYTERLILHTGRDVNKDGTSPSFFSTEAVNKLLQTIASRGAPNAGNQAERVFEELQERLNQNALPLRLVSTSQSTEIQTAIFHVISAYLKEHSSATSIPPLQLQQADMFLRRRVEDKSFGFLHEDTTPLPFFARVLTAYNTQLQKEKMYNATSTDTILAAKALFLFFVTQHLAGNVPEEPRLHHIQFLLSQDETCVQDVLAIFSNAWKEESKHLGGHLFNDLENLHSNTDE